MKMNFLPWLGLLSVTVLPMPGQQVTRGPYLQLSTANSIVVRWRTDVATDSQVKYGPTAANLASTVADSASTTEHIVTVTGLLPETKYYYSIGTSTGVLAADPGKFFVTVPPKGAQRPTRIWFLSDFGDKNAQERSVRDAYCNYIASTKPADVWLTGGDNDQTDGKDSNYSTAVFGAEFGYSNLLQNLAIWPTMGNHDMRASNGQAYFDDFSLPTNGEAGGAPSRGEHYYSFDYGSIHFISLDSLEPSLSSATNTPMLTWLRQDLGSTTQPWIIAYWHAPPYTKGSHDSDNPTDVGKMVQMRENVLPILETEGVDLVLCGHSHVYERSWLLQGHYGYSTNFSQTNKVDGGDGKVDGTGAYHKPAGGGPAPGTVYVVAAVGGHATGDKFYDRQHPADYVKMTNHLGSCVMDVNTNRLDFQYIDTSGKVLDHFTLLKDLPPTANPGRGSRRSP